MKNFIATGVNVDDVDRKGREGDKIKDDKQASAHSKYIAVEPRHVSPALPTYKLVEDGRQLITSRPGVLVRTGDARIVCVPSIELAWHCLPEKQANPLEQLVGRIAADGRQHYMAIADGSPAAEVKSEQLLEETWGRSHVDLTSEGGLECPRVPSSALDD
ncbi:hypothetical protein CIB48_g7869 [Xylaria polymorpha]|nr:hypothetical protein CIB48_g7869 [Xylaria polymorpha]